MARTQTGRWALMLCSAAILAGCGEGKDFSLFKKKSGADAEVTSDADTSTTKLVERDVEAPEVFQVSDKGLWDGRPSLGGVWVAHPDVAEPERVIIRNAENDKFVIGALFKRERENPGPAFQVSSDAAAALGMLAGAPSELNVTALRRQEVPISPETPAEPETTDLEAPEAIETATLGDPAAPKPETAGDPTALAAAALTEVEGEAPLTEVEPTSAPADSAAPAAPAAPPKRPASALEKPFIQIGLFSVQDNADRNGTALRNAGILPTIRKEESNGKTYWRVLAGPAPSVSDRRSLLAKVKKLGYSDAYFVRN
ncbi:SPOR domain-containing protein [Psychromarinibacter sp. C21-152]|uniref:SPOR domain-containing protein n=1 Tax=Psychromarinibacter sediminicola TaxID=3033385 RepID=A0AAE3NNE7_9RHOB|nr:SPOR domain-containing protein [Psychromarinibacter sediminicola]MDF0599101.1 SPOR domain-containing protein [Psychromarinibacter sediminicola]